jgi:diguanylate cyclase (GGDEF)-like protein
MPWAPACQALALAAALLLLAGAALAQALPQRPGALVLADGPGSLPAESLAQVWFDERGTATLDEVLQNGAAFAPAAPGIVHPLEPGTALWLRFRLLRAEGSRQQWLLVFANPLIDQVDLWQRDERGRWRSQSAGDTVAVERWPEPGRYPVFRLDLPGGHARDIYVQVRGAVPASVPLRLTTDIAHSQQQQLEYLGLGLATGALLLLLTACLAQSWVHRDRTYAWYAGYAALSVLCVLSYTGVAAHQLWPFAGTWADAGTGCLAALAAGAAILFVRKLTGLQARNRRLDRLALLASWAGVALALFYLFFERKLALDALAVYLFGTTLLNMGVAWFCWRRGDVVGMWVLLAYAPLTVAVLAAMLRLLGWLPTSFITQYAVVVAMILEVPLQLLALSIRSRDRHGAQIREQALASQDALTGLLAQHLFHDQLRQVVARFDRDRDDAAIVFIDLANHGRIRARFGQAVAEQSLLRSVIKLRKLVRDVDTVARIGEARFALIMEGVRSRTVISDRAARLIAQGLMPLPGLKPEITLQFHVAAVLLCEHAVEASELARSLDALLGSMSGRTRRPIRFLEPPQTQPAPLPEAADDSSGPGADSTIPPRQLLRRV